MKKLHLYLIVVSTAILFAASCGGGESGDYSIESEASSAVMMELGVAPEPRSAQAVVDETDIQLAKKIVKTGGINFESTDISEDYNKIASLLPKYGAFIDNENQSKSTQQIDYNVTVRVPAKNYDSLYNQLALISDKIDSKYSNVDDVTERYYDLEIRIKNKKALEARYVDLLKKAVEIKDILEIERNINQVRVDIEQLEGQFRYLSKQVSLSTINLYFYEVLPYTYDATTRKGFGARMFGAFDSGWQGFLSFMVGITAMWPFLLILFGVVYTLIKLSKRRKALRE